MSNMVNIQREDGPISINPDRIAFLQPDGNQTLVVLDNGDTLVVDKEFAKAVQLINSARRQ